MYEVLKNRPGWVETQDDVDWDLCWADVGWVRDMYDQIQVGNLPSSKKCLTARRDSDAITMIEVGQTVDGIRGVCTVRAKT